jgi:imidazolonepropionase-like amidohydrolase
MGRLILTGANLVDGEHPAKPNSTVVVEGNRITSVGPAGPEATPEDRVVALNGKTVMPGMYSCHFHSAYHNMGAAPGAARMPLGLEHSATYYALLAADNAKRCLMSGFTGAAGASTIYDVDMSLKAAIDRGIVPGPRLLASSRDIVTTGDSPDARPWFWGATTDGATLIADGPDEFRKAVRSEIKRGAEIIKLYPTGGHGVRLPKEVMTITESEVAAAADAAHERGKLIRGHIVSKRAIVTCVEAGVDVIDHADEMDAECIELFLKAGSFVLPSLYYPLRVMEEAEKRDEADQPRIQVMRRDYDYMCSMLAEASQAGVKFAVGDDFGTILTPHGDYAKELEIYVRDAGVSPLEVIKWATKNGAELMGMDDRLGTIEAGKLADLLVVDGDPTIDITVLQDKDKLLGIMKDGELVKDWLPDKNGGL